jgi:hypothetical protein
MKKKILANNHYHYIQWSPTIIKQISWLIKWCAQHDYRWKTAYTTRTIIPGCRARPINEGNTERGASSPANPALHIPEPRAAMSSSSAMVN